MKGSEDVLVAGIGNESRRDDACGLEVVRRISRRPPPGVLIAEFPGDLTDIIDLWQERRLVVVVDAMRTSLPPGTIVRSEVSGPGFEESPTPSSTHGLSLVHAVGLGRALGKLPAEIVLFTIEAREVRMGIGLSREVEAAVPRVVAQVLAEVARAAPAHAGSRPGGIAHA